LNRRHHPISLQSLRRCRLCSQNEHFRTRSVTRFLHLSKLSKIMYGCHPPTVQSGIGVFLLRSHEIHRHSILTYFYIVIGLYHPLLERLYHYLGSLFRSHYSQSPALP
jgi:hypothetical protein